MLTACGGQTSKEIVLIQGLTVMVIYIQGRMNSLVGPNVKSAVLIHFENIASNTIFEYDCILLTGLVLETSF